MKDYAGIFAALDALPAELRHEVMFAATMWEAPYVLALYKRAERDIGRDRAIDWVRWSIVASDESTLSADMREAGVKPLRYRPVAKRRRRLQTRLVPEVLVVVHD